MHERTKVLANEILKLPEEDKDYLLSCLIHHHVEIDEEISPELMATIERREFEVEECKVVCTPAEDTITYMRQKIENDDRRAS